jgi:predicted short-subunit dehydrogenase-like oxidoreductase (DUF2520 family)
MANEKSSISLIGAGNVGYHLGRRLHERGFAIQQVFSRHLARAEKLAQAISAEAVDQLDNIRDDADLYILAVHDDAIAEVAAKLPITNKLLVHTSGATPSTVLAPHAERFGILYPLQTFSAHRPVDVEQIPVCVFANSDEDVQLLEQIARRISSRVYRIDDAQRAILHVAAVFVNNFANYMFQVGYDILEREDLAFDLLRPLILETAQKVQDNPPGAMQTGPAVRGDQATIEKHLKYLQQFPAYQELYKILTRHIQNL